TERPLDTAFTKEGQLYKVLVQNEDGASVQYTRNGAFYLSPIGENELALVNGDGLYILDESENPIYINGEPKEYQLDQNGRLTVKMTDETNQTFDLGVVQVNKPQFLEANGNNLYKLPNNLE